MYAPTTDHKVDDIEAFYIELEDTMKQIHKEDILIVQGDFNAKVGTDSGHTLLVNSLQARCTRGVNDS